MPNYFFDWTHDSGKSRTNIWYRTTVKSDWLVAKEHFVDNQYQLHSSWATGTLLDIGANIGVISAWWAGYGGKVIAVEPDNANHDWLSQNMQMNSPRRNYQILQLAVAPADVKYVTLKGEGAAIYTEKGFTDSPGAPLRVAKTATLDTLIEKAGRDVELLKIDIEGGEWEAIQDVSEAALKHVKRIAMEVSPVDGWNLDRDIVEKLSKTHVVRVERDQSGDGGLVFGVLR